MKSSRFAKLVGIIVRATVGVGIGLITAFVFLSFRLGSFEEARRAVPAAVTGNNSANTTNRIAELFIFHSEETLAMAIADIYNDSESISRLNSKEFISLIRNTKTNAERKALWNVYLHNFRPEQLSDILHLLKDPLCPNLAAGYFAEHLLQIFPDSAPSKLKSAGADWKLIGSLLHYERQTAKDFITSVEKASNGFLAMKDIQQLIEGIGVDTPSDKIPELTAWLASQLSELRDSTQGLQQSLSRTNLEVTLSLWNSLPVDPRYEVIFEKNTVDILMNGNSVRRGDLQESLPQVLSSLRPEVSRNIVEGIASRNAATQTPKDALQNAMSYEDPLLKTYAINSTLNVLMSEGGDNVLDVISQNPMFKDNPIIKNMLLKIRKQP